MSQPIRWGILGPGKIANKFAQGLQTIDGAVIQAVASRTASRSEEFAATYGAVSAYGSYQELVDDPNVDVVYVATPHSYHKELVLMSIAAGKHVVCEKPMGINAAEVEEMIQAARTKGVFLMEALWTYFLPVWKKIGSWIEEGKLGEIRQFHADFSFKGVKDLSSRLYNPDLAGGALLDIGIYPIVMAYWVFGRNPSAVTSLASLAETKVDAQSAYLFQYDHGEMAILNSSFEVHGSKEAVISGTEARVRIPLFWRAQEAILENQDGIIEHFEGPHRASGLEFEAEAAMEDIRNGKLESSVFPQADSLRLATMFDRLRKEWGVVYPGE